MSRLFDIDSPGCPILVMIGVSASAIDAALQFEPRRRVVLVEPNPDLAALIETQHAGQSGVSVLSAAVTGPQETGPQESGPMALVQYNQPGLRSSLPPTDHLKQLFPGLKPRLTQDVRSIALAQVWQDAGLDQAEESGSGYEPQEHTRDQAELWLDTGGREAELLQAIIDQDGLENVARIVLRCGQEPLFDGALGAADLVALVRRQGFALVTKAGGDPDLPELHFERDILVTELRQMLRDQQHAQDQARAQYAALEAKFQTAETGHAEQISMLQAQLAKALKDLTQTTNALEAKSGAVTGVEEQLVQARRKIGQHTQELAAQAVRTQNAVDKARSQTREQAQKARALAEAAAATAQTDLALALRMQTLAQSDLRDLQIRYDRVERTCQSQATLLQKLTPRLQQAAAQLQALTLADDPHLVAGSLPVPDDVPTQVPTGPGAAPAKAKSAPKSKPVKSRPVKSGSAKRSPRPSPKPESPR